MLATCLRAVRLMARPDGPTPEDQEMPYFADVDRAVRDADMTLEVREREFRVRMRYWDLGRGFIRFTCEGGGMCEVTFAQFGTIGGFVAYDATLPEFCEKPLAELNPLVQRRFFRVRPRSVGDAPAVC